MRTLAPSTRLFLGAAFYLGVTASLGPLWSEDLWWHLRTGQLIVEQHALPHADPYSYTRPGAPWVAHEWGYEVLVYAAYAAGGWLGIIYLTALLVGLTALLAAGLALRWRAGLFPAVLGAALLAFALGPWVNARPQMLDPLYLLVLLHLLTSYREGRSRALWWMPPLFLVWANTHGTFVMGWALVGLWGVWQVAAREDQGADGGARVPALQPEQRGGRKRRGDGRISRADARYSPLRRGERTGGT